MAQPEPYLLAAWRRIEPDISDFEVSALLPIVKARRGLLGAMLAAYRAGVRDAAPLPPPLSGFRPCPGCLSVRVSSVGFDVSSGAATGMAARCADCGIFYDAGTGEPWQPADSPHADHAGSPQADPASPGG